MKTGIGIANGKLILIGEHSVVYGMPAIAIPFKEVRAITTVSASDSMTVNCIYHNGFLSDAPKQLENLQAVVSATMERLGESEQSLRIEIDSTIPVERGMGSSAAVANSVVKAIYAYYDQVPDDETLFELTQISEAIAHGNPSGLDARVTVSDRPLYYIRGKTMEAFDIHLKGYIVVGDTGENGQTMLAVNALGERRKMDPAVIDGLIHELGELSERSKSILAGEDLEPLGVCMDLAQDALSRMGISNGALDHLIEAARIGGALGAKLTGGGWGGCMLALTKSLGEARQMEKILMQNNAKQTWVLAL